MIFDTLLSRTRLRERMNEETNFQIGFPSQLEVRLPGVCPEFWPLLNRTTLATAAFWRVSSTARVVSDTKWKHGDAAHGLFNCQYANLGPRHRGRRHGLRIGMRARRTTGSSLRGSLYAS